MSSSEIIRNRIKDLADNYYKGSINAFYSSPMSIIVFGLLYGLINPTIEVWAFVGGYIFNEFMGIFFGIIGEMNSGFKMSDETDDLVEDSMDDDDMDMDMVLGIIMNQKCSKEEFRRIMGLNFGYITGFFLYKFMDSKNYKSAFEFSILNRNDCNCNFHIFEEVQKYL